MAERKSTMMMTVILLLFFGISFGLEVSDIKAGVDSILTEFNTDLNKILGLTLPSVDAAWQTVIEGFEDLLEPVFQLVGGKAACAQAPPLSFGCNSTFFKSDTKPTSAHAVRIGDIDIIAGIGDSVMAGLGTVSNSFLSATTIEGRGYCAKAGGTGTVAAGNTTISTIMRDLFNNRNLRGYAVADGQCSQMDIPCAQLNVADKLALYPQYILQAIELVRRIVFSKDYNEKDWKMIHIFYGANDLCLLCQAFHYQENLFAGLSLRVALRILHKFLNNTLVYLHIPYDLTPAAALSNNLACELIQNSVCPCARLLGGILGLGATVKSNQGLIAKIYTSLVNDPKLNDRDDFTISEIKHLTNTKPPKDSNGKYMPEILSANCVHPSRAAHYIHARYVINEMFTAPNDRPLEADYSINTTTPIAIKCPTQDNPYLRTYKN